LLISTFTTCSKILAFTQATQQPILFIADQMHSDDG